MTFADQQKFVVVWQTSSSLREASTRLGMDSGIVRNIASGMRTKGVDLKKFSHVHSYKSGRKLTREQLQELQLLAANSLDQFTADKYRRAQ